MGVELVTQDNEACLGIRLDQPPNVFNKVPFGPGVGNRWGDEFASSQMDIASEDLCAVSDVVELSAFDFACVGRQGYPIPLKGLETWFFVSADDVNTFGFVFVLRRGMQFADLLYLLCKLIPIINVGMFPISTSVWL